MAKKIVVEEKVETQAKESLADVVTWMLDAGLVADKAVRNRLRAAIG